jgi:AhpD family alkylhydroperoxidase
MARIAGVSTHEAGPLVKLAYFFTRRHIARLSGRETERMIEPLELYAHLPGLLRGYARLEQATARLHRFDERLRNLAELKAATLTNCEYCIDLGSQIARRSGLSDEQLLALPSYRTSALFTDLESRAIACSTEEYFEQVGVAPARFEALAPDADRGRGLLFEQLECETAEDGEVLGTVA